MQRMMTACYFTPKMSVVRRKDKLFFRVGIPRGDAEAKTYKCQICDNKFSHERTLTIHMRSHRLRNYSKKQVCICKTCGEVYKDRKELVHHKRIHVPVKKARKPTEKYACEECEKKFSSKSSLLAHQKKDHEATKVHECEICQESFTSESYFKKHVEKHSNVDLSVQDIYSCKECSKAFLKLETLNEHLRVHSEPDVFGCFYCGKPLDNELLLQEHVLVHEEGNPYNCEACDQKFPSETLMINHLKSHRPRPFTCSVSDKF